MGITAILHPATDAAWGGWLYHTYFFSRLEVRSNIGANPDEMHTMVIDSKAMRKVDDGQTIVSVIENPLATGVVVALQFRLLVKLH